MQARAHARARATRQFTQQRQRGSVTSNLAAFHVK